MKEGGMQVILSGISAARVYTEILYVATRVTKVGSDAGHGHISCSELFVDAAMPILTKIPHAL